MKLELFSVLYIAFAGYFRSTNPNESSCPENGSPVNLTLSKAEEIASEIRYWNGTHKDRPNLVNNGEKLIMRNAEGIIKISTFQNKEHELQFVQFIWPTEHTIEDKRYDLEMQMIFHYEPASRTDTRQLVNEFVIVSTLFAVDISSKKEVNVLDPIVQVLNEMRTMNDIGRPRHLHKVFSPLNFVPNKSPFFSYNATYSEDSDCLLDTLWIIYERPLKLFKHQLDAFYKLRNMENKYIRKNYRELKPLVNRILGYSFNDQFVDLEEEEQIDKSSKPNGALFWLWTCVILNRLL